VRKLVKPAKRRAGWVPVNTRRHSCSLRSRAVRPPWGTIRVRLRPRLPWPYWAIDMDGNGSRAPDGDSRSRPEARRDRQEALSAADVDQSASDADQSASDADQSASDADQTGAERDEGSATIDQRTSDEDQAVADAQVRLGSREEAAYNAARKAREATTIRRLGAHTARSASSRARLQTSGERDATAAARDEVACQRDIRAEASDAMIASHEPASDQLAQVRERAASDRRRAAEDRASAAADRAQTAAEIARLEAELQTAHLDDLTGAYRREVGTLALHHEMERARRMDGPFVIAFVDVDHLKVVNDRDGHAAGDHVLQRLVWTMRSNLRSFDPVVRFGGDEFIAGLGGIELAEAGRRFAVIDHAVRHEVGVGITVGLAQLEPDETLEQLTSRADAVLLGAKSRRNT
jgi:diguanylate cyclase (GGDEF)-like protein